MNRILPFLLLLTVGCYVENNKLYFGWKTVDPSVVVPPKDDPTIQSGKLRALIVDDNSDRARAKLTSEQRQVLFNEGDPSVRDFLSSNCIESKDSEGAKDEGWRLVHKGQDLSGLWAEMLSKYPPQSYPWLILVNGNAGIGVAIESEKQLTPIINKYAGVKP